MRAARAPPGTPCVFPERQSARWEIGGSFAFPHLYLPDAGPPGARAYDCPLMTLDCRTARARASAHLAQWPNLVQCGRQGTFRYTFTDTALEMGQMAAAMLIPGQKMRAAIHGHRNERSAVEAGSVA